MHEITDDAKQPAMQENAKHVERKRKQLTSDWREYREPIFGRLGRSRHARCGFRHSGCTMKRFARNGEHSRPFGTAQNDRRPIIANGRPCIGEA
ncbi:hypothetical protein BTO02_13685 [Paraburkholderia sp. SOS3]|nr:hypothetical protein BTO02_13685 [Paraburkholderia sp. SOS3]